MPLRRRRRRLRQRRQRVVDDNRRIRRQRHQPPISYQNAIFRAHGYVRADLDWTLVIAPLDVIQDARELHSELGASSEADLCRVLAGAEKRLARDASNQADGQRWWLHPANVLLNTGVGLFLALGYRHWAAGAFNAVGGSAIGELIILTQPTRSIEDLRRYRSGDLDDGPSRVRAGLGYARAF